MYPTCVLFTITHQQNRTTAVHLYKVILKTWSKLLLCIQKVDFTILNEVDLQFIFKRNTMQLVVFTRIHCMALLMEWFQNRMVIIFLSSRLKYRKVWLVYENDERLKIELWDQSILESGHLPVVAKSYSVYLLHLTLIRLLNSYVWFKLHETGSVLN